MDNDSRQTTSDYKPSAVSLWVIPAALLAATFFGAYVFIVGEDKAKKFQKERTCNKLRRRYLDVSLRLDSKKLSYWESKVVEGMLENTMAEANKLKCSWAKGN